MHERQAVEVKQQYSKVSAQQHQHKASHCQSTPLSPLSSATVPGDSSLLADVITPDSTLTTTEAPGVFSFSISSSISFNVDLQPVFSISSSRGSNESYTIISPKLQKLRLVNPSAVFARTLEQPGVKDELVQLMTNRVARSLRKPQAYFIVGLVIATDAAIRRDSERTVELGADASVPLGLTAGALPIDLGVGVGAGRMVGNGTGSESRSVGVEIWGVEYMKVCKSRWGGEALGLGPTVEKVRGGRFFGNHQQQEEDDEDDDDDDDDDDEISWKLGNLSQGLESSEGLQEFLVVAN